MTNGPFEMRHEEGGYVEFLNEDVPTIVREIDGRVAILTTLEKPRKVVGYRVYDPGSSPSEVFGSASPAGVGVETDKVKDAFNHGYVLACCTVANLHDEPGIAFDVLQELGITAKAVQAMGLCEYDAAGLRKIEEARSSSVYRASLKGDEQ